MKRKGISNNVSFIDISFGKDSRLWAVSDNNEAFQYKDKTKSFKKLLIHKVEFLILKKKTLLGVYLVASGDGFFSCPRRDKE